MAFPPPIRITAPLLALAVGLVATWFEYQLNLELDLARHLKTLRQRAESNSRRLAQLSEYLLSHSRFDALEADIEAITELPQFEIAGVVDRDGRILADSTGMLRGKWVNETPLERAARLITPGDTREFQSREDERALLIARSFRLGAEGTGWVLLQFDRAEAIDSTRADARTQLVWMASAMALLSFVLWAILHFVFAARLGRLADSVRAFGEGKDIIRTLPGGSDEVGKVSAAFEAMAARLHERETEQARLEREVLGISESERRRIGRDLHDGLGQRLTAASMIANSLISTAKFEAPALTERAEEIGSQLRKAIAEVRFLSHGLAPVALVEEGFMGALAELADVTTRGGGVRCIFECPDPVHITDEEAAEQLYRIAQEAVTNAIKHAAPSEIRIGLERRNGALVLEVDDDGPGFDESSPPAVGIGLRVMRYRARLIGAELIIGSAPAGGTRINCKISSTI